MTGAVAVTCQFAGIFPLNVKTYTTTYPFRRSGWAFAQNALQPMEFNLYQSAALDPVAFTSQLIDYKTGYTKVDAGTIGAATFDNNQNPLCFVNEHLRGFLMTQASQLVATWGDYYAPLDGGNHVYASLNPQPGFTLPNLVNTGTPWPGAGMNWALTDGSIYVSSAQSLAIKTNLLAPNGLITTIANSVNGLVFPSNARFGGGLPGGDGFQYIFIADGSGGAVPYIGMKTDYVGGTSTITMTMINPATTTLDINALFLTANNTINLSTTYGGWLFIYKDTQTFNGVTCNGYGILISRDFTSYAILQFIYADPLAATIPTQIGAFDSRIDRNGGVWLKNFNNDNNLWFASPPPQIANVANLPPMPLVVNPGLYR